ncbi:Rnase Y domain-containing protein, partial [Staphylococcus epidermidis]|uniref:Rnase Y domain-containing protein n=1 Tax=Staphylococcus epidermidis TaxID=1282 RepID=UPI003C77CE8D
MNLAFPLILAVIMLIVGLLVGSVLQKKAHEREIDGANKTATGILAAAEKEAATRKKEIL